MTAAWLVLALSLLTTLFGWWRVSHHARQTKAESAADGAVHSHEPGLVLLGGLGLSGLLFTVVWIQGQRLRETERFCLELQRRDEALARLNAELKQRDTELAGQLREASADLRRFKAIVEATSDFVNIADTEGRVLYMNPGAMRMAGLPADHDPARLHVRDLSPEWVMRRFVEEGFPTAMREGVWRAEVALKHRDGHEIPVSFVGLILKSPEGQPLFMACIARDISDQRLIAEELKRALAEEKELNALKGTFLSMVSHEVRTPLALILSSAEILGRYFDRLPVEKRQRHLATIEAAVQRMALLVDDALMFSRAEAGRLEFHPMSFELAPFCHQLVEELAATTRRRCPIEVEIADEAAGIARGDQTLLRQILGNLINNATKYSPAGKTVAVKLRREQADAIFVVQDHGLGIPDEDQARLFTPFHRGANVGHIPGTGLGLIIVHHCVQRHGGRLEIQSQESAGTLATVRLPLFYTGDTEQFLSQH
jgi:PAS domain S-box-containing protein